MAMLKTLCELGLCWDEAGQAPGPFEGSQDANRYVAV